MFLFFFHLSKYSDGVFFMTLHASASSVGDVEGVSAAAERVAGIGRAAYLVMVSGCRAERMLWPDRPQVVRDCAADWKLDFPVGQLQAIDLVSASSLALDVLNNIDLKQNSIGQEVTDIVKTNMISLNS